MTREQTGPNPNSDQFSSHKAPIYKQIAFQGSLQGKLQAQGGVVRPFVARRGAREDESKGIGESNQASPTRASCAFKVFRLTVRYFGWSLRREGSR